MKIPLFDLTALLIRCRHCKTELRIPLDRYKVWQNDDMKMEHFNPLRISENCPGCKGRFGDEELSLASSLHDNLALGALEADLDRRSTIYFGLEAAGDYPGVDNW